MKSIILALTAEYFSNYVITLATLCYCTLVLMWEKEKFWITLDDRYHHHRIL